MSKNEFYIGYLEKAPGGISKFVKIMVALIFSTALLAALLIGMKQGPFVNSTFEFGVYKELTGRIYKEPYPMLVVESESGVSKTFLLGVFGKSGAQKLLKNYEATLEKPIENYLVSLKGSLIYYDGKTMFELDNGLDSFLSAKPSIAKKRKRSLLGRVTLEGEILDTKCHLGVMKPGNGKTHRSCAVRCISGGVAPAFGTWGENGFEEYALITGPKGQAINSEVLPLVGKTIELTGELIQLDDWKVLQVDPEQLTAIELSTPTDQNNLLSLWSSEDDNPYLVTQCF